MNRAVYVAGVCLWTLSTGMAADDMESLRQELAEQHAVIVELQKKIEAQGTLLDRLAASQAPAPATPAPPQTAASSAPAAPAGDASSVNGIRFSGDFRLRLDAQFRSGNEYAAPVQNVRGRYRLRLNIDKQLDPRFRLHAQLSTGALNNPITNEQEMAGLAAKHPFSIAEAFVEYRPNSVFTFRAGRTEEVFADNMRFLWDDDVRFNGFTQSMKFSWKKQVLGFRSFEAKAAEFLLTNPAVYVLAPSSPYVSAGYQAGGKVRSANLFHPGVVLQGAVSKNWSQQLSGGLQVYRNPNQIQLASTAAGFPVLVSGAIGVALASAPGGAGNATTTPGGANYAAPDFHV